MRNNNVYLTEMFVATLSCKSAMSFLAATSLSPCRTQGISHDIKSSIMVYYIYNHNITHPYDESGCFNSLGGTLPFPLLLEHAAIVVYGSSDGPRLREHVLVCLNHLSSEVAFVFQTLTMIVSKSTLTQCYRQNTNLLQGQL